ncbi:MULTISPECIES: DUF924 family protein [Myxococcaceae]|uniref:DUF924 family protein n=1 Tax=Myxococcaceae TaxID=31 RepID=UPI001E41D6F4|nr:MULTISPECIES: DUF924 family protein [Myxococcaceae]
MTAPQAEEVLEFWFGEQRNDTAWLAERNRLWFGGDADTDARIRERFLSVTEAARAGALDEWATEPRGLLALVILLDQFSRTLYRGTAGAFDADLAARALVHRAHAQGWMEGYTPLERIFLAMPLMHSEALGEQDACVAAFERLVERCEGPLADTMRNSLDYARRHRDVVQRFGRFPHRNDALGRPSTAEEMEFLKQPGSRF